MTANDIGEVRELASRYFGSLGVLLRDGTPPSRSLLERLEMVAAEVSDQTGARVRPYYTRIGPDTYHGFALERPDGTRIALDDLSVLEEEDEEEDDDMATQQTTTNKLVGDTGAIVNAAAYSVAANQLRKRVLQRAAAAAPPEVAAYVDTPVGSAVVCMLLAAAVANAPIGADEQRQRLADALRVQAYGGAMDWAADFLLDDMTDIMKALNAPDAK